MATRAVIYFSAICWCKKLKFGGEILLLWRTSYLDNKRNYLYLSYLVAYKVKFGRWVLPWPDDHFNVLLVARDNQFSWQQKVHDI